jgi:hypothetical protein
LLFHTCVDAILQKPSLPKPFNKFKEEGTSHLKNLTNLYIIRVVDVVQLDNPFLILDKHWTISYWWIGSSHD